MIKPGSQWFDMDGNLIQAHGGGILYHNGIYYWYGENKNGKTIEAGRARYRVDALGVNCYSSRDLITWNCEGTVLKPVPKDPSHDLHPSKVIERPKVVYNDRTGKYVMWMHVDTADYLYARAGIAVSDSPTGPFEYIDSMRPNGWESRDLTVFKDDDGSAYLIYSSNDNGDGTFRSNGTLHISLLTDDYLSQSGTFTHNFVKARREAPAIFKRNGRYYCVSSGCSGWDPNEAEYAISDSVLGPWEVKGNPCIGPENEKTFYSQSTFVLPLQNKKDAFIFMADRWIKEDLRDSRYVWLPIMWEGDRMKIAWRDEWDLSMFE
ncbi:MAG: family 43 glycosylhydrolase [Chitinivibrionales bacterium]|nr:family 43 glycosylhydrolase [Chitinivibrionales bacterium]